jgi:hypothetical protein
MTNVGALFFVAFDPAGTTRGGWVRPSALGVGHGTTSTSANHQKIKRCTKRTPAFEKQEGPGTLRSGGKLSGGPGTMRSKLICCGMPGVAAGERSLAGLCPYR